MGLSRRLLRVLLAALTAASFVALVAVVALWVRSYRVADGWTWSDGVRVPTAGYQIAWRKSLVSRGGKVWFTADRSMGGGNPYSRRLDGRQPSTLIIMPNPMPVAPGVGWRVLGFVHRKEKGYPAIASTRTGPPVELTRIWAVPYWAVVLLAALLPAARVLAWGRRRRRAQRVLAGLCAGCGYDLRASGERCPECGARR